MPMKINTNNYRISIVLVVLLLSLAPRASLAASTKNDLKEYFESLGLTDTEGNPVTILSAELITDMPGVPEHVRIEGVIWPETRFVIKLPVPEKWNGRYIQIGGGGLGGMLNEPAMLPALSMGYAVAANNQGHEATKEPGATYAYPDPIPGIRDEPNPYWRQKEEHYCYKAAYENAVLAKKVIEAYYGSEPLYSYFIGASNGGREGLKMAQMFPEIFNGILVGMPVLNITWEALQDIWNAHAALLGPGAIPVESLSMLAKAVYEKCDSVDGLIDNLIDDPRKCKFDPIVDLAVPPYCYYFTPEQRESLAKIYEGPRTSWGFQLFYGTPVGGEALMRHIFGGIMSNWAYWVIGQPNLGLSLGGSLWQYMATEPRFGPEWDWRTFNFDVDPFRLRPDLAEKVNAVNPDLRAFKERGGKIIHWHGWADQLVTPYQSIAYYESVVNFMGEESVKEFYRLYMIPGLTHVGSIGPTFTWYDPTCPLFKALIDWVENGIEPSCLILSRRADPELNLTARTFLIPPYPLVARYIGKGSIDDAQNYIGVELIPAEVHIVPKTINLSSRETFTAFIRIPEGYNVQNFTVITCEGAAAVSINFTMNGRVVIAKFNPQNLINIKPKENIIFTVTAIFEQNGRKFAFEGSDTVRVIEFDISQAYLDLKQKYDELSLNYATLMDEYSDLQTQLAALQQSYKDLQFNYTTLKNEYNTLNQRFKQLQSEYSGLQSEISGLKASYNSLSASYKQLQSIHQALQQEYEKLKPWQYIAFAFIALTIIFMATTVYFMRKKPR
ncbi:MAG: tannase/feruloyl esterase family alpha/beta hydrolase [Candidatus Bathyarchaeia archaeon]|nr:tannase/feruloyl esterase family alpha/beta hydrolase [Candidatus Bathyarchaeota archaeon]